ncbi:hypothetical protein [Streptomyces bluensis]
MAVRMLGGMEVDELHEEPPGRDEEPKARTRICPTSGAAPRPGSG